MSFNVKGDMEVMRYATSSGNNLVTSVNGIYANINGIIELSPPPTDTSDIEKIISVLPLSKYGTTDNRPVGVSSSGFTVTFNNVTPVLMSGKSFTLPPTNINLTTVNSSPRNKVFHVYVLMVEGIAKYKIVETPIAETGATGYNILWIGTITTNETQISLIDIIKRARLDIFGPSETPAGASFPVSSGYPSGTGSLQW